MSQWYPKAVRVPAGQAGVMDGSNGSRKIVIHTEGVARGKAGADARGLARYVAERGIAYHFVVDPWRGTVAQCYPVGVASRALEAHSWSPNRQGVLAVQVCFAGISDAGELARTPLKGWPELAAWLHRVHGIPLVTHVDWDRPARAEHAWRRSGVVAHCHAPEQWTGHTDGVHAPIGRLLGKAKPAKPAKPKPAKPKPVKPQADRRRRRFRLVVTTRLGRRKLVYLTKTGYSYRRGKHGRLMLTAGEVEAGKRWAARRAVRQARTLKRGEYSHLELAPGVKWPTDRRLLRKLNKVGRDRGRLLRLQSGLRDLDQQAALYAAYQRYLAGGPYANKAAPPNPSAPHVRGVAADLGVMLGRAGDRYLSLGLDRRCRRLAEAAGLAALVNAGSSSWEAWHWQRRQTY